LLRTHESVNVKDILYSAKCEVQVILFEVPETVRVETVHKELNRAKLKPDSYV